jgi:hypothetical protein
LPLPATARPEEDKTRTTIREIKSTQTQVSCGGSYYHYYYYYYCYCYCYATYCYSQSYSYYCSTTSTATPNLTPITTPLLLQLLQVTACRYSQFHALTHRFAKRKPRLDSQQSVADAIQSGNYVIANIDILSISFL